jgi:hypothetical protein
LTNNELIIGKAFEVALVYMRAQLRDYIRDGYEIMARAIAVDIVRVERAAHLAWNLPFGIQDK